MLKVRAKVVFNHLPKLTALMRARAGEAVRKTTEVIQDDSRERMQGPKSGHLYPRPGKWHQASAPGEAPAVDFGFLVESIQVEFPRPLLGVIYTNEDYAALLEYGTGRMAARPYMTPSAIEAWPSFLAAMMDVFGDG